LNNHTVLDVAGHYSCNETIKATEHIYRQIKDDVYFKKDIYQGWPNLLHV